MFWPLAILLVSNVMYNVCAKCLPSDVNPLAAIPLVYIMAAIIAVIIYFAVNKDANLLAECRKINWVVPGLALCVIGMEIGTLYLYKVGWPLSVGMLINQGFVAIALVIIGCIVFKEPITVSKLAGVVCIVGGLYLLNR